MSRLIFAALLAGSCLVQAQRKFGIMGGINNPMFTEGVAREIAYQPGTGIHVGVFYEMELNRSIHFRPRLMFSQQGDRDPSSIFGPYQGTDDIDYRLSYLNVPMDIKFWNKVYLVMGPQVGFLVGQTATGAGYPGPAKSSFDFGANLGFGVNIHQTFLELGIYQGLTPVVEDYLWGKTRQYHNALARFSIGWRIF